MKNKQTLILLALIIWIFTLHENSLAQRRNPPRRVITVRPQNPSSPELQRRVEAFNMVWETLDRNYFDQTFSGLNWNSIKKEYEPRILKTTSDKQLHDILEEMINRLNRSHFAIIPPEIYQAIERTKAEIKAKEIAKRKDEDEVETPTDKDVKEDDSFDEADYGTFGIGVEMRLIDNRFVITRIEKGSSAELKGLKIGYIIQKVNDVSLDGLLLNTEIAKLKNIKRQLPEQIIQWVLNGEEDTSVTLTFLDETDKPKEVEIRRERLKSEAISLGANYPEQQLKYETSSLNDEVGYIKFNLFALPVVEKFCNSLTQLKDKKAIIVDLRGNSGGLLATMVGLSGMLTDQSIDLGTSIYKVGSSNMIGNSKAKNFKGRLVFLVNDQTISAAEVFAAALQENNRALIVGEKTAGEALPAITIELPTGAVLLYPIANYKTRNGNFLEGKGVQPNFVVALDRKSLLEGKDAQLETALKIIKEDKDFPKTTALPTSFSVAPPPPPPPAAKPKIKVLAEVTVKAIPAPPPPVKVEEKPVKDEKSLKVISEFVTAIGGKESFNKINSYLLNGSAELGVKGSKQEFEFSSLRQKPDKYSEFLSSETAGEIREIYNGKKYLLQTDYGIDRELPNESDTAQIEILSPISNLADENYFKSLTYNGTFERKGRKTHVISGKTSDGANIALAFDVETKYLVSYIASYSGISFDDYRKVGDLMLPFTIERENVMTIKLDEIRLNTLLDEAKFNKKEHCFDRPN
jgi:carboxyl-terminal processing protease